MMMLVVCVEDCIRMMLRKKWHEWIECTLCQLWYHTTCQKVVGSCVMVVRIPMTVNNHTMFIQKGNVSNLYH